MSLDKTRRPISVQRGFGGGDKRHAVNRQTPGGRVFGLAIDTDFSNVGTSR